MTNKERLVVHNDQIKNIDTLLKNKKIVVISAGGKAIDVPMPNEFAEVDFVYYFVVNDNTVLFSYDYAYAGLWIYKISSGQWTHVYTEYGSWRYFQKMGDKCLITSLTSNSGVLLYDASDDSVTRIHSSAYGWSRFIVFGNKCLLISTDDDAPQILLYNAITNEITEVYNNGYVWRYFQIVGDKCLFSGDSSSNPGILVYDSNDDSVDLIHTTGYNWRYFQVIGDKCLISSNNSSSKGLLVYNSTNNTIRQLYDGGYSWEWFTVVGDKCFISGRLSTIAPGLLYYNSSEDSMTLIMSKGYRWTHINTVGNNKYLISSDASGTDNYGVFLFDASTNITTQKYTSGYKWKYCVKVEDKYLISSELTLGLLSYDPNIEGMSKIYQMGAYYTQITAHEDGYYVECGDKSLNERTLYYTPSDNKCVLAKIFIGDF